MALYIGIKNLIGKGAAWLRSKWTTIVTQLKATFRYRVAGGSDNALLPGSRGRAILQKVYGKTVKFNQLIADNSIHYSGTATATSYMPLTTFNIVSNHVVYYKVAGNGFFQIRLRNSTAGYNIGESYTNSLICISNYTGVCQVAVRPIVGDYDFYVNICDLTAIFGTDAEIAAALGIAVADITTATGAAAFENWLALNVGTQDYYPYNEGSLVSFTGQGVKVTGWNKFHVVNGSGVADVKKDVKYYVAGPFGSLHYSDGTAISVASDRTFTAIKDDTITFGSVSNSIVLNIYTGTAKDGTYEPYHEEIVDLSGAYINVWDEIPAYGTFSGSNGETFTPNSGYLASQNKIKVVGGKTYYFKINQHFRVFYYDASGTFISSTLINNTEPSINLDSNVGYIRFQRGIAGTYQHDICINVSNADINGTYFPHALQSAGSAMDEDTATELTKKVFEVNLGELTFSYDGNYFRSTVLNVRAVNGNNGISYPYKVKSLSNLTIADDKTIGLGTNQIYIRDTDHDGNDLDNGKATWLQNTPFIYEMQVPITIPHDTPMQYAVDKHSTEELLVPASVAGEPTSTAMVADIEYQAK